MFGILKYYNFNQWKCITNLTCPSKRFPNITDRIYFAFHTDCKTSQVHWASRNGNTVWGLCLKERDGMLYRYAPLVCNVVSNRDVLCNCRGHSNVQELFVLCLFAVKQHTIYELTCKIPAK